MQTHRDSSMRDRFIPIPAWLVAAATFLTAGVSFAQTPDTFTWYGTTHNWNDVGVWTGATTGRMAPGIRGDGIVVSTLSAIKLTNDVTLSSATYSYGGSHEYTGASRLISDGFPAKLFIESAVGSPNVLVNTSSKRLYLGAYPTDSALEIELKSPLRLYQSSGSYYGAALIGAKLVGGTVDSPALLVPMYPGYGNARCMLMNSGNTFSGDLHVGFGSASANGKAYLHLGAGTVDFSDGMLGNVNNKIFLYRNNCLLLVKGGGGVSFARRVIGTGTVKGGYANIGDQYTGEYSQALTLGAGCSIEPAEGTNTAKVGAITLTGTTLSMDANAQVVFSVTGTANDTVKLTFSSTSSAINFTGKVAVEELASIAPGRQLSLMTVTGNIAGFTFSPSSTPSEYAFTTTGDATAGWTVKATRLNTSIPAVQNLDVTLIGETNATLHASVNQLVPDGEGVVRAYYGETNSGSNLAEWEHVAAYPGTVTAPGVYDLVLNGLQVAKTYYVCHSISNSAGEYAAADVVSFTTRPWETPDVFTWVSTNADWHTAGVWLITTPYQRKMPEFKGDKIIVNVGGSGWPTVGVNRTLNITNDVAIGAMTVNEGYGSQVAVTATNGPAKLTFDSDASGTNSLAVTGQLGGLRFGNTGSDYGLTIELKQPLMFQKNTAYGLDASFYAGISGGTEGEPVGIYFNALGDQYCEFNPSFLNTNNTFRGDIFIGMAESRLATTMLTIGNAAMPARNEMLGDGANQVILRNKSTLRYHAGAEDSATCERHVVGTGKLASTKALHLEAGAVLEPLAISGSGYGTITVEASDLTADADARYVLDLSASGEGNDGLVVNVSSPLALTGQLELVPEADEQVAVGTSWDVIQVAPTATSFTSNLKKSPGFILTTTGDAKTGWTVTATAAPLASMLIVR